MLSKYEQESILLYNEAETDATVHTYDRKLIAKLERLALKYPDTQPTPKAPIKGAERER